MSQSDKPILHLQLPFESRQVVDYTVHLSFRKANLPTSEQYIERIDPRRPCIGHGLFKSRHKRVSLAVSLDLAVSNLDDGPVLLCPAHVRLLN